MPIVGTAGHVDHGKSTLVGALTGRDPDRWAEEKARGLTIDLGFAWTDLGGVEVGFVDVPGHERFIKNMLAGVGAIDVGLLVVAADEGWMPQTEEHAAVLQLLRVRAGVIAVTRVDLVDDDGAELAILDVMDHVAGTVLEGWPIVPVSAPTGLGLGALADALGAQVAAAGPPRDVGRPRLWIDRSFHVQGAGMVVTGTLVDGPLDRETPLFVYPSQREVRIRGIQTHERTVSRVPPGTRTAVNIIGVELSDAPRGTVLARPGDLVVTRRLLATIEPIRSRDDPPAHRGAYHLHLGSATVPIRLRLLDDGTAAVLRLGGEVAATMGDRFVLRDTGRRAVVGGGRVLDPMPIDRPAPEQVALLRSVLDAAPDRRATALVEVHGALANDRIAAASGGGTADGFSAGGLVMTRQRRDGHLEAAVAETRRFQADNPMRAGIPKQTLASAIGVDAGMLDALLRHGGELEVAGGVVRTAGFASLLEDPAWEPARRMLAESAAVPRASQLGLDRESLHARIRSGDLVRVGDDLVYLPEQVDAIVAALVELPQPFTVAEFRDHHGLTRRQAVPLLEWLDAQGWTRREGDVRTIRRRPSG